MGQRVSEFAFRVFFRTSMDGGKHTRWPKLNPFTLEVRILGSTLCVPAAMPSVGCLWGKGKRKLKPLYDRAAVHISGQLNMVEDGKSVQMTLVFASLTAKSIDAFTVAIEKTKCWHPMAFRVDKLDPTQTVTKTVEVKINPQPSRLHLDGFVTALIFHDDEEDNARVEQIKFIDVWPLAELAAAGGTVLVVGPSGAGKTATIRTLITATSRQRVIQRPGCVHASDKHVTDRISHYSHPDNSKLIFIDTFGYAADQISTVARSSHKEHSLRRPELVGLINGSIPPGWPLGARISHDDHPPLLQGAERKAATAYCYVMDGVESDNDEYLACQATRYKEFVQLFGMEGPIVLTKLDRLYPKMRTSPMEVFPEVEELKKKVARAMGAPAYTVHHIMNYDIETERVYDIDRCAGLILEEILKMSAQFNKYHADKPKSPKAKVLGCDALHEAPSA